MPDKHIPDKWRVPVRLGRTATYAALMLAGLAAMFLTPTTIASETGHTVTYAWAAAVIIGALGAGAGTLTGRYRWEWVAIWPLTGGIVVYATTIWGLILQGEVTRSAQALFITSVAAMLVRRGLELAAHAYRLRMEHMRREE